MTEPPEQLIDDALTTRRGESVTAVVRLSEPTPAVSSRSDRIRTLQHNAARAQREVTTFASQNRGVQVTSTFWITNALVLEVDTARTPLTDVARLSGVERIHENFELVAIDGNPASTAAEPAPSSHGEYTYGLEVVAAPQVWEHFDTRGAGARVAVLDTGVDPDHRDLSLAEGGWAEFDADGNELDSEPSDSNGHGTHVSGTVAGGADSGEHIGVAPEVDLYHGGVLTDAGGTFGAVIAGIQWAVEEDVDVINMSLGPEDGGYVPEIIAPLQNAKALGTLPVSACGNSGTGTSGSPANVYGAGLAVGATTSNEGVPFFSSGEKIDTDDDWGEEAPEEWPAEYIVPDIVAPGDKVVSSVPGGGYATYNGTSMASPHVAGVAGLIVAASGGDRTPAEISDVLETTAWKPAAWDESDASAVIDGKDTSYGEGIVDALSAVAHTLEEPIVAATATHNDGTIRLSLDCAAVSRIVVDSLWSDWTIENVDFASDFTDNLRTDGRCWWDWGDTVRSVTLSLTLEVPTEYSGAQTDDYPSSDRRRFTTEGYVGGTYVGTVTGTTAGKSDETTVTVDLG